MRSSVSGPPEAVDAEAKVAAHAKVTSPRHASLIPTLNTPALSNMTYFVQRLLVLGLLGLFLAGCSTGPKLGGLTARLVGVAPLPTGEFALTFEYANDNLLPVGLANSSHQITLEGVSIGRVESKEPLGLPRLALGRQTMVVALSDPSLVARLLAVRPGDPIGYQMRSTLFITAGSQDLQSKSSFTGNAARLE